MPIDASIALQARGVQLDNPMDIAGKALTLRGLASQQELQQMQVMQAQRTQEQERTLADLYRGSVNPDGTVDRQKVLSGAATRGLGARIPGMQKDFAAADKAVADVANTKANTVKTNFEVERKKVEASAGALQSLLSRPNVTHDDVIQTVVGLVQQGIVTPEQGQQSIRALPGDPVRLRQHLMQEGLKVMDAKARLDALLPKLTEVDDGKVKSFVDTNPLTNPGGPKPIQKTTTPDSDQTAATSRRGQNMTDSRERALAATTVTYQQTEDGNLVALPTRAVPGSVVKATNVLAAGPGMQPLMGKSNMTEDQGKASGWLAQATNAFTNMQNALAKNTNASQPGLGDAVAMLPLGGAAGRALTGPERQEFNQAASSLAESILRAATGAGVNKDEAKQKVEELVPQFGDKEDVRKQKMDAIPVYLDSLRVRTGPAGARKVEGMNIPKPVQPLNPKLDIQLPPDLDALLKKHGGK